MSSHSSSNESLVGSTQGLLSGYLGVVSEEALRSLLLLLLLLLLA
jgi:hypothetical protein